MKKLELKNLGVQEMNTKEMSKVEGGGILGDVLGILGGTLASTGALVGNSVAFLLGQVGRVLGGL